MKNMTNEELFEAILMNDDEMNEALATGDKIAEAEARGEFEDLWAELSSRHLEADFEQFANNL